MTERYFQWFGCLQNPCKSGKLGGVRRYVGGKDSGSTGSLRDHVNSCCKGLLERVEKGEAKPPNEDVAKKQGKLTKAFRQQGNRETYSTRSLTNEESR